MSNAMDKLLAAVNKTKAGQGGFKDPHADKFWRAEQDATGNAYCVIRFLPGKTDDDVPFIKTYSHGFKNDAGRWFIEPCPTTIERDCPVCTANGPLWNSGIEKDKEIVRQRKRKVGYMANILVVSDPKHPENDGKVFIFKFGQKIFDKIIGALTPEFEDEKPMNPFDAREGANFKLKIRKVEGYANYDKSEFDKPGAIGKDKEIDAILTQLHDLSVFISPNEFKSYEELEKKFNLVIGNNATVKPKTDSDDEEFVREAVKAPKKKEPTTDSDDDADSLAYFQRLANEE